MQCKCDVKCYYTSIDGAYRALVMRRNENIVVLTASTLETVKTRQMFAHGLVMPCL